VSQYIEDDSHAFDINFPVFVECEGRWPNCCEANVMDTDRCACIESSSAYGYSSNYQNADLRRLYTFAPSPRLASRKRCTCSLCDQFIPSSGAPSCKFPRDLSVTFRWKDARRPRYDEPSTVGMVKRCLPEGNLTEKKSVNLFRTAD
jgi:hypothetical protein